ncbi:hypothetical protein GH714_018176 [Hevea brasiliensis]|uniref:Leucine-rich repeat-containing N-terminal plant-type domain-containing protein n=1 Tax=Hevea brasiliensis TaxID=3981 RepID=A0A6A6M1Q1_HEVBR|nr:hypothetical protein GH714_018176 [Hevea brasiliensis]
MVSIAASLNTALGVHVALVSGGCQADQQSLLVELKNTLKFNQYKSTKLVAWNYDADCCGWAGVTCDKNLDLSFNNFNTSFPAGFANLTRLISLNLSNAGFMGQIPIEISNITKLVTLDLSMLYYLGVRSLKLEKPNLATLVQSLTQLRELRLDGQVPNILGVSSSSLGILDLSGNKLEGPIPRWVFNVSRLNVLLLSSNQFSGTIKLDWIQKLHKLDALDLSYNNLTVDANVTLSSFPQMNTIKLASCNLRVFPDLRNQSKLVFLDLSDNQINGEVPRWIGEVGSGTLLYLNLSQNLLVSLPEPLSLPTSLSTLDLHNNVLQGNVPLLQPSVTYVDCSNNNFSSSIPPDIVLDLSHNSLSGTIPPCLIERSKTLGVLNLRRNKFKGNIPDKFPSTCELKTLDLNGNLLEGKLPKSLANCTTLEVLDLGNNKMNDIFPCLLKNISSLRVLVLRKNNFHGKIGCPKNHGPWPKLQIVDLASNNFGDILPNRALNTWEAMKRNGNETDGHLSFEALSLSGLYYQDSVTVTTKGQQMELVKILTIFTSIDFSYNHFVGPIPDVIGQFSALYTPTCHTMLSLAEFRHF